MSEHLERIGQQIGDYRLLSWLGSGSSGHVYLAEQRDEPTLVTIKLLQARLTRKAEIRTFINEARMIRLTHPHILPVMDFGISHEIPYLVMEYASLGTLRDRFPRGTQVPLSLVVRYTKHVAAALQYAHERRLIHRDVKPENMLLRDERTLLLSDFGIVATVHGSRSLSLDQDIIGTPLYIAPEQLHGRPQTASDQYSLGVVVYEWLSGHRLFDGTLVEIVMRHDTMLPPALRAYAPALPEAVERVVFKALEKEPGKRFESMMAFAEALEQASNLSLPESANSAYYILQAGDTLESVAQQIYGQNCYWEDIYGANIVVIGANPRVVPIGTKLYLPRVAAHQTNPQTCAVTAAIGLNIRISPNVQSAIIANYPQGTILNYVGTVNGEIVAGNPLWGLSMQGHFFWMGGTDHPEG